MLTLQPLDRFLDHPHLLVAWQAGILDQYDAGVQVASLRQLHEVGHVAGHQDAILFVGPLHDLGVGRPEHPSLANVDHIDPCALQLDGDPSRQVLIDQQLHVAPADGPPSGRPG